MVQLVRKRSVLRWPGTGWKVFETKRLGVQPVERRVVNWAGFDGEEVEEGLVVDDGQSGYESGESEGIVVEEVLKGCGGNVPMSF